MIQSVCPDPILYPDIQAIEGCSAVVTNWSGGAADTLRNRLLIWGGGHGGYFGNEVYSLNLNENPVTLTRLNEPSVVPNPFPTEAIEFYSDGKPASRHTYGGLDYVPSLDAMFSFGGSLPPTGSFSTDLWMLNASTLSWAHKLVNPPTGGLTATAYDPNTGFIFLHDMAQLWKYDPVENVFTPLSAYESGLNYLVTAEIDPERKQFWIIGRDTEHGGVPEFFSYDISSGSSYDRIDWSSFVTGCSGLAGDGPGLAYDPIMKLFVGWNGGNNIYLFNPDTVALLTPYGSVGPKSCLTLNQYTGGPAAQQPNGTYGRFRYFSKLNVYALVNDIQQNAYVLKLTNGGGPIPTPTSFFTATPVPTPTPSSTPTPVPIANGSAEQNFQQRCASPGVLSCQGFDTDAVFNIVVSESDHIDGFGDLSHPNLTRDTSVFLSGGSSANFYIPAGAGENDTGNWWQFFGQGSNNKFFGQNSTFYVQYGFRADAAWTDTNWTLYGSPGSNTAPKLSIFHNSVAGSCAAEEITIHNHDAKDLPTIYTECGGRQAITQIDGSTYSEFGPGGLFLQQGWTQPSPFTGYQCEYDNGNYGGAGCFHFTPYQWYTLYFKITVGTWGNPDSAIEVWVAPYGQQMKQLINTHNYILQTENLCDATGYGQGSLPCKGWNVLELTQFMTGKIPGTGPGAHVWYDEVIISSQPIPAPGGQTP